jgi:hypothetical protein
VEPRLWPSLGRKLVIALAVLVSMWAVAALYFDVRIPWLRVPAACLYSGFVGAIVWFSRSSRNGILLWLGSVILVLAWWFSLAPTNIRSWQPDVAELPWADRHANLITVYNVRNFFYRAETDYTQRWEIKTVDLSQIRGVDLFLTHFGSPLIAHAIVSFQFGDGTGNDTFLAMSIEQRRAIGQSYSTLRGFFRQYELIYLVADERDVVRLRTDYRTGEYVRLYHTLANPDDSRRLFLRYLQWIETLRSHPQWYNALTDNCTTSVTSYLATHYVGGLSRWDWRSLLNGLGDRMLYDDGDLAAGGLSFQDLAKQALINDAAKRLGDDPNFSRDIRQGHPGFKR